MNNIIGISTCKGRLSHIQTTVPLFLNNTPEYVKYLLVDYDCPEKSGDWLHNKFYSTNRVEVIYMRSQCHTDVTRGIFHKPIALNAGIRYAVNVMRADYIILVDADTIIKKGFFEEISPLLSKDKFIISKSDKEADLTGFIIFHKDMYFKSGGFEPSFMGWGAEDLEFRLRLFAKHHYLFDVISDNHLSVIHHDNELRTKYYTDKDIEFSNRRNFRRLKKMYQIYTGNELDIDKLLAGELEKDQKELSELLSLYPRESND